MATINATVHTFMGMTDLASRGIGTGMTINHPSIPAFLNDSGRSTGVNYASTYFNSMLGNQSLGNVISEYDSAKSSFQAEFKQAMGDAKKTGEALRNVDYRNKDGKTGVQAGNLPGGILSNLNNLSSLNAGKTEHIAKAAAPQKAADDNAASQRAGGNEKTADTAEITGDQDNSNYTATLAHDATKTPPLPDAKDKAEEVSGLIDQYNDTVNYLQSKVGMSSQFDYFAAFFNDTKDLMGTMENIGVNVEPVGTLSVDTETLARAIEKNPDSVQQALGEDGLAGQIDRKTSSTEYQANRMFPTIDDTLGRPSDSAKGMYAPNMQISSTMRGDRGNLMDMYY